MKGYNKMNKQSNELINNYEKSIVLMILSCISELEINVGKSKLVSILQGSESNYIFENNFNIDNFISSLFKSYLNQYIEIIKSMKKIGSKNTNIEAIIGPCINVKNYEVDEVLYRKFTKSNKQYKKFFLRSISYIFV